jgi:ABC-type polar amino acid transport system ATPase subunit
MIEAKNLSKAYGAHQVLSDISLSVARGETLAIIGRSGTGKSTLLKCLSVLTQPNDGDLLLDGQQYALRGKLLFEPWEIRRKIVLVFQELNLFPNMTVLENIAFSLRKIKGLETSDAIERSRACATALEIDSVLDRYPHAISGGQAQRCALARAIVLEPHVLLLDEITSALDPESVAGVIRAIRKLRATDPSGKLAIILVTHLLRFAQEFSDTIAFMHSGRIVERLPASDFASNCTLEETRSYVAAAMET